MKIAERIKDCKLNKTNMPVIHGHTKIVLKNVKTGLVETVESENTFQGSMVAQFLHNPLDRIDSAFYNSDTFRSAPYKAMIGGLLLFRDAITVGEQFMPAGNVMVGKASDGIVNLSDPPELGSYNEYESAATGSSIMQVFDFATSQANGTISCVCLTSKEGGLVGYGNTSGKYYSGTRKTFGAYYGSISSDISGATHGIMAENGKRYVFEYDGTTKQLSVKKYRTCGNDVGSVFAGLYTTTSFDMTSFPTVLNDGRNLIVNYCGNNIFRIYPEQVVVSPGNQLNYMEYDAANDTLTAKTLTNSSNVSIRTSSNYYSSDKSGFTADGRFLTYNTDTGYPLLFDLTTEAVIADFTAALTAIGARYNYEGLIQLGPDLYMTELTKGNATVNAIIDMQNNTIKFCDSQAYVGTSAGSYAFTAGSTNFNNKFYQGAIVANGTQCVPIVRNPLYLATINNLPTPVTKSATQTMKVTYTLTEA